MDNKETIEELEAKLLAMQNEMKTLTENLQTLKSEEQSSSTPVTQDNSTPDFIQPQQPDIPIQNNMQSNLQNPMQNAPMQNNFQNPMQNTPMQNNFRNIPQNIPPAFQPNYNAYPNNYYNVPRNNYLNNQYNIPRNNYQRNKTQQRKNNNSFENVIGKSFMGIVASLLIFIGIILFAKAVAPYITEIIKLVALYVVSFVIIFFGLSKLKKNKNDFFISLTACGLGMLYITIILTYSYFNLINEIILLCLLLIWCIGVLFLSKYNSVLFIIIGRIGVSISIIAAFRFNDDDFFIITIFALITMIVYGVFDLISTHDNSDINNGFNLFNFFILYTSSAFSSAPGITGDLSWIILSILPVLFIMSLISKYKNKDYNESFLIFNSIYALWFTVSMVKLYSVRSFTSEEPRDIIITTIIILVMLAYIAVIEYIKKQAAAVGRQGINYIENLKFVPIIVIALNVLRYPFVSEYIGFAIIIIPLMLAGFIINSRSYQNLALILLYLYVLNILDINWICVAFIGLVIFILTAVLMTVYKNCYRPSYKKLLYILFLIHIMLSCANVLSDYISTLVNLNVTITAIVMIHFIVTLTPAFSRDFNTKVVEPATVTFLRAINLIIMLICLLAIIQRGSTGLMIWASIIAIASFSLNTINLCKESDADTNSADIYICLKYLLLDIIILKSFSVPNIIISISWIILAVAYIIIGVMTKRHQFRISGLILTMVSIFKLLMLDIFFINPYMRALGFIISGILCFIISLIYNSIDKKLQNAEDKPTNYQ